MISGIIFEVTTLERQRAHLIPTMFASLRRQRNAGVLANETRDTSYENKIPAEKVLPFQDNLQQNPPRTTIANARHSDRAKAEVQTLLKALTMNNASMARDWR